jgi:hypothetical protein
MTITIILLAVIGFMAVALWIVFFPPPFLLSSPKYKFNANAAKKNGPPFKAGDRVIHIGATYGRSCEYTIGVEYRIHRSELFAGHRDLPEWFVETADSDGKRVPIQWRPASEFISMKQFQILMRNGQRHLQIS